MVSSRGRALLAAVAIALGTAVAMAAFTTSAAVEESLRQAGLATVGNADLVVDALDDAGFPGEAAAKVAQVPGVTLVAPQVQRRVFFRTPNTRGFVQLLGVDPSLDARIGRYTVSQGRSLDARDTRGVLLVKGWAEKTGLLPGSTIDLMSSEGLARFEVVGLLDEADLSGRSYGGLVRLPIATAQSLFGMSDRVHKLSLQLRDREEIAAVQKEIARAIDQPMVVRETPRILDEMASSVRDLRIALLFFVVVTLSLGGLLAFSTLSLAVSQQVRQIGLLRAAGVHSRIIVRASLAHGLALGAIGAIAGVLIGQVLAVALVALLGRTQGLPAVSAPFPVGGLVGSLVLGVGVAVAASVVPAMRAGRISPLGALSGGADQTVGTGRRGRTGLLSILAFVLLVVFVFLPLPGEARLLKLASLLALFLLAIFLCRAAVSVFVPIAAFPVRRFSRGVGVLAQMNVERNPGQASLTAVGFVVSTSLVVALANGSASFSTAGEAWADSLFPGEYVVVSPVDQPLELIPDLKVAGVDFVTGVSMAPVVWQGMELTVAAIDPSYYLQSFDFRGGDRLNAFVQMRRSPVVLVPHRLAQDRGINLGDSLVLDGPGGQGTFRVEGIIVHSLPSRDNYGALIITGRDAQSMLGMSGFRFAAVAAAPGADRARLEGDLAEAAELYGMEANTVANLKQSIGAGVAGLVGLLGALAGVALVLGSLSAAIVMLAAVAQRFREIAILRTQGMTARSIRWLFIGEGVILGLVGTVVGIGLGAFLSRVLVDLSRSLDFDPRFVFSPVVAVLALAGGLLFAVGAAWYPSRVAARTRILESLVRNV